MPREPEYSTPTHQAQQAQFFNISLDLLCVLDADGHLIQANPAFKSFFKTTLQQENPPDTLLALIYAPDQDATAAILEHLPQFRHPISFECRFKGPDGTLKWYLWTMYPQDKALFHAVGRDITPYKEMENKEQERNIFAEALLDTVLAINASLALEQVLKRILSNIGKVVAYDYVNILLIDGIMAEVVGSQTKSPHHIEVNLSRVKKVRIHEDHYLHFIFTTQECIIVPDVMRPPSWMITPSWMQVTDGKHKSGSFLGAPIVVESKPIGFLGIFNAQKEFFTPLHAQQLMTFANQVGIAIINARLYEQSQSAAILRERQRVAKELHDSVNQELFAASTYADLLIKAIHTKPDVVQRYAADISHLVRGAVEQMRMILIELHPDTLTKSNLPMLIKQLGEAFSTRTGIPVTFHSGRAFILETREQIAVYRIVQEILHNIEKHAQASHVFMEVQHHAGQFNLRVKDDGIGFDPHRLTEFQFGLRSMQERAASIEAHLTIDSQFGQGTSITLKKDFLK